MDIDRLRQLAGTRQMTEEMSGLQTEAMSIIDDCHALAEKVGNLYDEIGQSFDGDDVASDITEITFKISKQFGLNEE